MDIPTLKRAYDRAQEMSKDGVVSQATLDDAQRNYIMAVNKRDVARAQLVVNRAKVAQAQALKPSPEVGGLGEWKEVHAPADLKAVDAK